MKKRQVLALTLAAAMVMGSSMSVLAAAGDKEDTTGVEMEGTGDISYVDTKVYNVLLPTTNSTTLVVDPQGISQLEEGKVATAEQLAAGAGLITCATTPLVTNLSSVPMKVSVAMSLTGDATAVTTVADVEKDENNNVLLYAVPSAADTKGVANGYAASTTGVVLPAVGTDSANPVSAKLDFILDAAAYNFSKDASGKVTYVAVDGDTGHGTGLQFGGYVNKKADWADYVKETSPKKIGLRAKFTFTNTIADGETADATEGAPYAMKAYTGDKVTVTPPVPEDAAPSVNDGTNTMTYTISEGQDLVIPYSVGAGDSAAEAVTDVVFNWGGSLYSVNGTWGSTLRAEYISIGADSITIKNAGFMEYCTAGETYAVCVIFDDDADNFTQIDVTCD